MRIGDLIQQARSRAGLSQKDLAERVGVIPKTVGKWERGEQSPARHLVQLEDALGVTLTNRQPISARPTDLAQMSNAELVHQLSRIAAEVARRLPTDATDAPEISTTHRNDLYDGDSASRPQSAS